MMFLPNVVLCQCTSNFDVEAFWSLVLSILERIDN